MEELYYKRILCPRGTLLPKKTLRSSSATYVTLTSFIDDALQDLKASRIILAIAVAIKTVSAVLRKKAVTGMQVLGFLSAPNRPTDIEISNEIFFQMIKDTGVVWQVGCATHVSPDTFLEYENAEYVVNFSAQDGSPNLPGTACYAASFAIYKRKPELFVGDHILQPGKNILYSGYSIYGTSTVFYLSLSKGRVDSFLLDPLVGEFVLVSENVKIPIKSPLYTINEGKSFYYSQEILDWLDTKKNPQNDLAAEGRYIVSKIADIHRVLKNGGIYCHPDSKVMNVMHPHHLVYECIPMAHIITQAGGLATDGTSWLLDIVPKELHSTTALFIGSAYEVELLLQYVNPKLLQNEEELKIEEKVIKSEENLLKSEENLLKSDGES